MAINYENINKGGISLAANFELLSEKPLDSRSVVPVFQGLQDLITSNAAYEGMLVYDEETKKTYQATACEEYTLGDRTYNIIFIEFIPESEGMQTNDNYGNTFGVKEETLVGDVLLVPNEAVSLASNAEGNNTIAGVKAFQITDWESLKNVELADFIRPEIENSNVLGIYTLDSVEGITPINLEEYFAIPEGGDEDDAAKEIHARDKFSIKYSSNYDFYSEVVAVGPDNDPNNLLQYIDGGLLENQIVTFGAARETDSGYTYEKYGYPKLWFPGNPTIGTTPWGTGQHSEGDTTKAVGTQSHAEGYETIAAGRYSHAEGRDTVACYAAHSEGRGTRAFGERSHTEGNLTIAKGYAAHAEGNKSEAIGNVSHAGGTASIARGQTSFVHGFACEADGTCSFATGQGTKATETTQFVAGSYNTIRDDAALIIGNGSKDSSRSNAFVVMKDGSGELSKQGTSVNSIVIKDTLNKVVEQCGVYEETTSNNTLIVNPEIRGDHIVSTSNTGSIRKFGTNLLRTGKDAGKEIYNNNGIVVKADSERSGIIIDGTCTATAWALQPYYYVSYFPAGRYTFFVEDLNTIHTAEKVYIVLKGKESVDSDQEVTLARINSTAPVVEFNIDQGVAVCKVQVVIKAGETFENEHIRFQLQAGSKTDFVPYKHFTTIEMEAGEEVVIQIDDLTPLTLIAQTEGNTITCKYPVSTKNYVDDQFEQTWIFNCGTSTSVLD